MANLKAAEQILVADMFFVILLTLFGAPMAGIDLSAVQTIPSPRLAPLPNAGGGCAFWDLICFATGSNAIAQATAYIGWAVVNGPVLVIYFLNIMLVYANLVLAVTFSPAFSPSGIPIMGLVFTMLQLLVLTQVFRDVRGTGLL